MPEQSRRCRRQTKIYIFDQQIGGHDTTKSAALLNHRRIVADTEKQGGGMRDGG
jgi:hypothetical protein